MQSETCPRKVGKIGQIQCKMDASIMAASFTVFKALTCTNLHPLITINVRTLQVSIPYAAVTLS